MRMSNTDGCKGILRSNFLLVLKDPMQPMIKKIPEVYKRMKLGSFFCIITV